MDDPLDFFRSRIDHMIDLNHPLAVLAQRMPWQTLEASIAHHFARQAKDPKMVRQVDMFGTVHQPVGGGVSNAGRPRLPLRLMIGLLYLKHAFNESDEGLVARWAETPTWQYFCGSEYFEHRVPCDPSQISRFRKAIGEEGVEEMLAQTINAACQMKLIDPDALQEIIVDSTVQSKAIAYPTDSKLMEVARRKLVHLARLMGVNLKQTYERESKKLMRRAGGYAHARQFKRMRRVLRRQRTVLGRLKRDLQRKLEQLDLKPHQRQIAAEILGKAQRIYEQCAGKTASKDKLYAWHAEEVSCISKGKARQRYEFGVKVGIATTLHGNLVVGARAFHGNPFDGHTLASQMEQAAILMQDNRVQPKAVYTDLGYRGVDAQVPHVSVCHRGKKKRLTAWQLRSLPRRQAIEPIIGHLKADHRMDRCHLKGALGDKLHAVLCAAGYNIRWLLRAIARKGMSLIFLRNLLARVAHKAGIRTAVRVLQRYLRIKPALDAR